MRKSKLLLSLIILTIATTVNYSCKTTGAAKTNKGGKVEVLFDGTNTNQWKGYNKTAFPSQGWKVDDKTLYCQASSPDGSKGGGGDIITKKTYKNFELSLEWKIAKGGNSGIFYRAVEKANQPIWHSAPEMQILDNEKAKDAKRGKNGNRKAGSLYDLIPAKPQNANSAGKWNTAKIVCNKGHVEHWQNGAKVLEYELWTDKWSTLIKSSKFAKLPDFTKIATEGHIGLQDHGKDVWFRNIQIKEL